MNKQFLKDVLEGLSSNPKRLASKYFYDEIGDALFQKIMNLDDYYLTRSEYEILNSGKQELLDFIQKDPRPFNLVEFGAGDGMKTKVLLRHFLQMQADFIYRPIDISQNAINQLTESLQKDFPALSVQGIQNEYFAALRELESNGHKNVVLFLGSNIGNFVDDQAIIFLKGLYEAMKTGDMAILGFDLKKDPSKILKAYNDSEGVTRQFNKNLLARINRELNGNFDTEAFLHYPFYDPVTGQAKSYLISKKEQKVRVADSNFDFSSWEPIHMEISRKFSPQEIEQIAGKVGFEVLTCLFDDNRYFMDTVWKK